MFLTDVKFSPLVPTLLVGAAGIGKTQYVESQFDYTKVHLLSSLTEEDIGGIPYKDASGVEYRTIPFWVKELQDAAAEGKTVCLFLDELDKARKTVSDTLLTLIASKKMPHFILPDNCYIAAAANPLDEGGEEDLSEPMISRFAVMNVEPNPQVWCAMARNDFPEFTKFIDQIDFGQVNLVNTIGQSYTRRRTCPRTLYLSMSMLRSMGEDGFANVDGLLDGTAASVLKAVYADQIPDELKKSLMVQHAAVQSGKTVKPRS